MAKKDGEQKRKRSRKTRTAVEDGTEDPQHVENQTTSQTLERSPSRQVGEEGLIEETKKAERIPDQKDDFSSYYLRKVTMELEEDLEKIRSAGDFTDSSLPILITALRQGEGVFSREEKQRIMGKQS